MGPVWCEGLETLCETVKAECGCSSACTESCRHDSSVHFVLTGGCYETLFGLCQYRLHPTQPLSIRGIEAKGYACECVFFYYHLWRPWKWKGIFGWSLLGQFVFHIFCPWCAQTSTKSTLGSSSWTSTPLLSSLQENNLPFLWEYTTFKYLTSMESDHQRPPLLLPQILFYIAYRSPV